MSSFGYGVHTRKHIGVWLKYGTNDDIRILIKKSKLKRPSDSVERIVVSEYDKETNQVWLEVWCKSLIDSIRNKNRYNVFHIKTDINPYWSCDGDNGRGANFKF